MTSSGSYPIVLGLLPKNLNPRKFVKRWLLYNRISCSSTVSSLTSSCSSCSDLLLVPALHFGPRFLLWLLLFPCLFDGGCRRVVDHIKNLRWIFWMICSWTSAATGIGGVGASPRWTCDAWFRRDFHFDFRGFYRGNGHQSADGQQIRLNQAAQILFHFIPTTAVTVLILNRLRLFFLSQRLTGRFSRSHLKLSFTGNRETCLSPVRLSIQRSGTQLNRFIFRVTGFVPWFAPVRFRLWVKEELFEPFSLKTRAFPAWF